MLDLSYTQSPSIFISLYIINPWEFCRFYCLLMRISLAFPIFMLFEFCFVWLAKKTFFKCLPSLSRRPSLLPSHSCGADRSVADRFTSWNSERVIFLSNGLRWVRWASGWEKVSCWEMKRKDWQIFSSFEKINLKDKKRKEGSKQKNKDKEIVKSSARMAGRERSSKWDRERE